MLCPNCSKLATFYINKACARCQGTVLTSIAVICEKCSIADNRCAACNKTILTDAQRAAKRGCNCGRK